MNTKDYYVQIVVCVLFLFNYASSNVAAASATDFKEH